MDCEKVADLILHGDHLVTICHLNQLKDTITLPVSFFTEELHIVQLDKGGENGIVGDGRQVMIGNNHILVSGSIISKHPFKLYSKTGIFISDIGAIGNGPNEYRGVNNSQLDEVHDRIYLLPSPGDKILVYDFSGNYYDPIQLPYRIIFGTFHVNTSDSIITVFAPPIDHEIFSAVKHCAWTQDNNGKVINGVRSDFFNFTHKRSPFGTHVHMGNNTSDFSVHYYWSSYENPNNEMLYHYDIDSNILIPKFGIDYGNREIPMNILSELPAYYIGYLYTSFEETNIQGAINAVDPAMIIVEKTSLKGAFTKVINDYLGNIELDYFFINNGYYTMNYDPASLLELIDNALINNKMTSEMRNQLTLLKNTISKDDNNYILYAKLLS
jgi:hypothetical protein